MWISQPAICRFCYWFALDTTDDSRIHPRILVAEEGDTVKIDCSSLLVPGYTPTTWVFNNTRLFGLPYFQGPTSSLVLVSVKSSDSGVYGCFGLMSHDEIRNKKKYRHFIAYSTLIVYSKF